MEKKSLPKTGRSTIEHYILPNIILCNMVGLWPIAENSSAITVAFAYFRFLFAITAVCSVFVPEMLQITMNWGDIKILTGVGCVSVTVGQLVFKMVYLMARRKRMTRLYHVMRKLWNSTEYDAGRERLEELAYRAKIFTITFYLSCMSNTISFTTAAAIAWVKYQLSNETVMDLSPPFEAWYGPEQMTSPTFEILFVCQVIASLVCCAGICGLDATLMTVVVHVCGQFRLIQAWFCNINEITGGKHVQDKKVLDNLQTHMNKCVQHHQRLLQLAEEVDTLINPVIFVQILTSGLEICLSGFALTTNGAVGTDLLKFVCYLVSMVVQLAVWCWPGEILIFESQHVADIVYFDVPWYNLPTAYQKDLSYVIRRAQKHCRITAFKFETMSIRTLTTVFNTAGSYFTLLRNIQEKQD